MTIQPINDVLTYADETGTQEGSGLTVAHPPLALLTDGGTGPSSRYKVDVANTGFFAGTEFRTLYKFTANTVFKSVLPIDTIVLAVRIDLLEGECRLETVAGGTEGGVFSTALPIFGRNNMSDRPTPFYVPQVTISAGGTHTDGTVLDILINKTANNANFAASVGAVSGDERGIAAGTY